MFVRWKKRTNKQRDCETIYAVLVESQRQDGRVRQRFIKHLGGCCVNSTEWQRADFWARVGLSVEPLSLSKADTVKILEQIERRISRPAEDLIKKQREHIEYWRLTDEERHAVFCEKHGGGATATAESDARRWYRETMKRSG